MQPYCHQSRTSSRNLGQGVTSQKWQSKRVNKGKPLVSIYFKNERENRVDVHQNEHYVIFGKKKR